MADSTTTPCVLFPELFDRPLLVTFDVSNARSDGGAILLKAADRRLGLIPRLTAALIDERQPGKVRHGHADLLSQRIHGLALGYEDANDAVGSCRGSAPCSTRRARASTSCKPTGRSIATTGTA